jgi:hypothetical protein
MGELHKGSTRNFLAKEFFATLGVILIRAINPQPITPGTNSSQADVIFFLKDSMMVEPNFAPHLGEFKIIRFNSGKWFNPEEKEFVTIK